MKIILATTIMLSMAFVAASQVLKNVRDRATADMWMKFSPVVLFSSLSALVFDVIASEYQISLYVFIMNMMPSVLAMNLMVSVISDQTVTKWTVHLMMLVNAFLILFNIGRLFWPEADLSDGLAVRVVSLFSLAFPMIYVGGLACNLRNIKEMMKNGGVWANLCMTVDAVYAMLVVIAAVLVQCSGPAAGLCILGGVLVSTALRLKDDLKFVLWRRQERIIIESMRVSLASPLTGEMRLEEIYKELYERIVAYFETRKPYLDSELTINALVKELYSNKLYISRAISQYTGRNFCQFVNYYRITYSLELFRKNPDFKVHELATMCGFNSIVSYNMAFRLFMGENPSEWCRKERSRLIKKTK